LFHKPSFSALKAFASSFFS